MNSLSSRLSNANMSEAQLISAFWECYIPSRSRAQAGSPCAWLQHSLCVPNPPPALRLSLKALAMTRLGWLRKDDAFIHEGQVIYGHALRELQKALYDQHLVWQDETMATCNVLASYEVSRFPMVLPAVSHQNYVAVRVDDGLNHRIQQPHSELFFPSYGFCFHHILGGRRPFPTFGTGLLILEQT